MVYVVYDNLICVCVCLHLFIIFIKFLVYQCQLFFWILDYNKYFFMWYKLFSFFLFFQK